MVGVNNHCTSLWFPKALYSLLNSLQRQTKISGHVKTSARREFTDKFTAAGKASRDGLRTKFTNGKEKGEGCSHSDVIGT